jgi:predicted phage terminase large subunit-like protein
MMCQSWDCTFKSHDRTDFVVGQVWGRRAAQFYLLDEVRKQMSFVDTLEAIRMMRRKWRKASAILIEDKANGPAVDSVLRKEIPGIIMITPEGGKESRANSVSSLFEARNVFHPDPAWEIPGPGKERPYAWVDDHITELKNFPTGKWDDRVDCLSQALIWMNARRSNISEAMATLKGRMARPFG